MGVLDTKIQPGLPVTVNAEYHNELVDRLADRGRTQASAVAVSASRVVVRRSDDSINPSAVVLSDQTDWRGLTADSLYIGCSLTGIGELSATQIDPGASTTWTWDASTWGSNDLPTAVVVTFVPYFLIEETTLPSVATVDDLPGGTSGDKVLVRSTRTVYAHNGTAWSATAGPSWSAGPARSVSFVVEQAFDPEYQAGLPLQLIPDLEQVRLQGGAGRVTFHDLSSFPVDVTTVNRTVTAEFVDAAGASLGAIGLTITNGDLANWQNETVAARQFLVEATEPGIVEVTIGYAYDGTPVEITKRIVIGRPERNRALADDTPTPPTARITAGNGAAHVTLGVGVVLKAFTDLGTVALDASRPGQSVLLRNLAARLSPSSATDPELHRAFAAAETLRSVFASGAGGRVRSYSLTLDGAAGTTRPDLAAIQVGHMVYLPGGAMKITKIVSLVAQTDGTPRLIVEAMGQFAGVEEESGWISSNAELIAVSLTFGYGNPQAAGFPLRQFTTDRLLAPVVSLPQFEIPLPVAQPSSLSDGWYVTGTVSAFWSDGEVASAAIADGWVRAEAMPTGEPVLTVTQDGDTMLCRLTGSPFPFYGRMYWAAPAELASDPTAEDALSSFQPFPSTFSTTIDRRHHGAGRILVLDGHFRNRSGTSHPQPQRAVSPTMSPIGAPVLIRDTNPTETDTPPATNGVFWNGPDLHVSINGAWIQLTPAASNHYTKNELYTRSELLTKSEIESDYYAKTVVDATFNPISHSLRVTGETAGASITGDVVFLVTYDGRHFKVLAEEYTP